MYDLNLKQITKIAPLPELVTDVYVITRSTSILSII